eukprot:TRINITY_DN4395_c0_g1_i5.p1 TRINITY_DN4395_c0_g1~~TRINITY_DN4395_c0_g1_i5.p1  ORF type:complete len:562 (-),score=76.26 TRINITY_DN4395_c0_g1_i5:144-1829(-)
MSVSVDQEVTCNPPCCVHRVFGICVCDHTECSCGAVTDPIVSSMFVYHTYVSELRAQFKNRRDKRTQLDALLAHVLSEERKLCSDPQKKHCKRRNRCQRYLQNNPFVFSLSPVWESPAPSVEDIKRVLTMMSSLEFDTSKVFQDVAKRTVYSLRGMIVYYGLHYYAFFYSRRRQTWLCFDDERIKVIGSNWQSVTDHCIKAHAQPVIIFYEDPDTENTVVTETSTSATATDEPKAADGGCITNGSMQLTSSLSATAPYKVSAPIAMSSSEESHKPLLDYDIDGRKEISTSLLSPASIPNGNLPVSPPSSDTSLSPSPHYNTTPHGNHNVDGEDEYEDEGAHDDDVGARWRTPRSLRADSDPLIFDSSPVTTGLEVLGNYDKTHFSAGLVCPMENEKSKTHATDAGTTNITNNASITDTNKNSTAFHPQHQALPVPLHKTIEYIFQLQDEPLSRGHPFSIKRLFDAFNATWQLTFERTEGCYLGIDVRRIDKNTTVMLPPLIFTVECRVSGHMAIATSLTLLPATTALPTAAADPLFLCPARQKRFFTGAKYIGLCVVIKPK